MRNRLRSARLVDFLALLRPNLSFTGQMIHWQWIIVAFVLGFYCGVFVLAAVNAETDRSRVTKYQPEQKQSYRNRTRKLTRL